MKAALPENYRPSDDEEFMNPVQKEYFRQKLMSWRDQLLRESSETISNLQVEAVAEADIIDSAANEADRAIELRARDRERKLINKIEEALRRIEDGSYGFCEETGDPIGVRRLDARPIATLTIEAQERHERKERLQRDY
ncbi:MAG: RNA polymerase-binding protein DksA [Candidatus Paracaedibacteraceae bacterium]|jgi:DnaK suppressor protein|nr:RNA polymerase-binding protein DksA [Candidatus Paracaedibacteraceae bacterium]